MAHEITLDDEFVVESVRAGKGYRVRLKDSKQEVTSSVREQMRYLESFLNKVSNCHAETARMIDLMRLQEDDFSGLLE